MPNKINYLTKELETLKNKINQCPNLTQISSKEFLKYHSLISQKEKIESKLSKLLKFKNNILEKYSNLNEKWLYDDNMNCKTYCKLEQKAAYSRDKKLYKLGCSDSKPLPPLLKNIHQFVKVKISEPLSDFLNPKILSLKNKFSFLLNKSPLSKVNKFINTTLPIELTNVAIAGTKKCILGYRSLSNSISSSTFSRNISSAPVIQFISYINAQAKKEADLQSNSFRSRIKVDISTLTPYYSNSSNNSIQQDYDLAL